MNKKEIDRFIIQSFMKGGAAIHVELSDRAYDPIAKEMIDGYRLLPGGNEKTRAYINDDEKKIIFASRGTVPTDAKDLRQDALILSGKLDADSSARINAAQKYAWELEEKYPDYEITFTGHSLAGHISKTLAKNMKHLKNTKVEAYNSGSSIVDVPKNIYDSVKCAFSNSNECKRLKNVTENTTGIDPISLFASGKKKYVLPKSINVHSLKSFK